VTQPVRVLFVAHQKSPIPGANSSLLNLLDGLEGAPIEPRVLVPGVGTLTTALQNRGIRTLVQSYPWWSARRKTTRGVMARAWTHLRAAQSVVRMLDTFHPDLIYSNTSVVAVGALIAWKLRRPHIWHLREFGQPDHGLAPDFGRRVHRLIIGSASATICNSKALQKYHVSPRRRQRSHVIYNGVLRKEAFTVLEKRRRSALRKKRPFTFVIVGQMKSSKGQDAAIEALAELNRRGKPARLLIAGTGVRSFELRCRQLVTEYGLSDQVAFLEHVEDAYEAFLGADAALMCSRMEAMGRVTVEAMAAGLPVIGRDSGGTPELINHGFNGLLYGGTRESLADCMAALYDSPSRAAAMGETAFQRARELYTIEKYAGAVADVILTTAGRARETCE
jgi:glycosyltransferase involved in cell wall biosynthesis